MTDAGMFTVELPDHLRPSLREWLLEWNLRMVVLPPGASDTQQWGVVPLDWVEPPIGPVLRPSD
jgi:hypothetical protein